MIRVLRMMLSILISVLLLSTNFLFASDELYDAPGFDPHRDTLSSFPNEHIDPFTGGLTLTFEDIRLPGNGGLDLVIQRTFNSKNACNVLSNWGGWGCTTNDENTWLGYGWTVHFGRLFRSRNVNNRHVIEMQDGSRHTGYLKKSGSGYITKDYWLLDADSIPRVLTLTNGTKIYYGADGPPTPDFPSSTYNTYYATKIQDVYGNEINIYYVGSGTGEIDYVIDSRGKTVQFTTTTLSNGAKRLISISGSGVSITYAHTPGKAAEAFLTQAIPPVGNHWIYEYNTSTYDLTKITTPSGGIIQYTYNASSITGGFGTLTYWTVISKVTSGTVPGGTWTLAYSQGTSKDTTVVSDPCGRTHNYRYSGYGESLPYGSIWKYGLPKSKEIVGEESTSYQWTNSISISYDDYRIPYTGFNYDSEIYVPYLTQNSLTRDGRTYTTSYSNYDGYSNPGAITETGDKARNRSLTYWYNTTKNIVQNKPSSVTASGGFPGTFTTNHTYDANNGNLLQINKYGVVTNYTYWSNGNLYSHTDANANTTYYQWNNGRISRITNPIYSISRVINDNGTIGSETNGRGYATSFTYDGNLRLTSIVPPVGNPANFAYPADNSYKYENRGQYYVYHYNDGFGRPTGTFDIKGIDTDIVYKACNPKNYSTSNIGDTIYYDNFERVRQITHKDSNQITYSYSNSNVTATDEAGKNTYFTYNAFGSPDEKLLVSVTDALSNTTSYNYNILGSLTNITQGALSRTFSFDSRNFLTSESHPEKGTITYGRDNVGNLTSKTDGLGTTSYGYDAINRLRTVDYGTGAVTFTYDNANNRNTMVSPSTNVTYTYDGSNRLTRKDKTVLGILYTTQYGYDGNDNVTEIYYPSGGHVVYAHNNKNEVTSVTGSGWSVTNMTYYTSGTPIGLPQSFTYSNGVGTNLGYNARNLTTNIDAGPSSSVLDIGYGYDSRGNMTSMTKNYLDPSNIYGSKLYQLLHTVGGVPTGYNYTNNRLTSSSGGQSFSYAYNTDGDATYMNDGGLEYDLQYDRLHNLSSFNYHGGAALAQFSYDGDGMRVVKTSAERTVVYHYDMGGRVISETDNNGNLISDFAYANGKLVAKVEPGTRYFYHTDPAGTPLAMTDVSGSVVWRADYLPFGEENLISGTLENDFRFVGKENDKETGLYYFGARYMEAMIGRFISPDPIGAVDPSRGKLNAKILLSPQGLNRYAYALNNPYRYLDPDGLIWVTIESTRRTHLKNNLSRGILGWVTKEIGEGIPIQRGRPPFSDPAERLGEKRDLIQRWELDPKHPERDKEFPYRTRRIIEQTNQKADDSREYLTNDPDKPVYDYFPRVPDITYQNYPNVKYDYGDVNPEDRKSYWKPDTSSTGLNHPVIKRAP